ncbi:MAG: nuclear transport factor 2 family protein [Alphaproteobacteria bacterium]|nr:nuclear transport factor 2 family protein [Alphaproteobacteria bacterium]
MPERTALPDIIHRYLDVYNRRDVEALVACVSETVLFENVSNTRPSLRIDGRDAFARLAAQAAETFTLRRLEVRTAVIAGDHVAPEVDWTGTPAVDLGEFRAGERVVLRGASFFTISGDRLVRSWISVERPDSRQRISGP